MTWVTVDVDLHSHRKMSRLPNDSARYGWIVTLCEAKKQRPAGSFDSANHFKSVMGRFGRFLSAYVKAGLMDEAGGELIVHDWQQYQWAAKKAKQRETFGGQKGDIRGTNMGTKKGPTDTDTDTDTEKGSKEPSSLRVRTEPTSIGVLMPGVAQSLGMKR